MATKTQASTISFKTLNGVFEQPKMNHRRDFLRENKLSLRDLQKSTNQKLIQQQQEQENRQYKHIQKFYKSQEQSMIRRSDSQTRNIEDCKRHSRLRADSSVDDDGGAAKSHYFACRRAYSQQRRKMENLQPVSTCCCNQQKQNGKHSDSEYRDRMPRSASSVSVLSKAESCDKEIQTEDINDEDFLYEALKKCSSSDVHQIPKQKSFDQLKDKNSYLQNTNCDPELHSLHKRDQVSYLSQDQYEDNKFQQNQMLPPQSARSQNMQILNGDNHTRNDEMVNGETQDLDQYFRNIKISSDIRKDPEPQLSARSRQTLCSTSTKRSVHKLGNREDVRLPRYLEKEKREKEENRMREISKDHNCPLDHYAMSEEERLKTLSKAQQKMASLINELNHMPMTMETLRIRKRKVEIEKELTQIELDIRLYSKQKVYMPITAI